MKTVKILTILALVTMVCLNEVSEASFLDDFENPGSVSYTGSNSYGSGGSYTVSGGKLRITTGFDNTYSVMTTNTVVFNVGDNLILDVPAISGTGSVFMMCSTSAFQPDGITTFGFRFRRDATGGYARIHLFPGGIQANTPDPSPDKPATLMVKRTSETDFEYSIGIEDRVTQLGSFTLSQFSGNIDLHIGAQAYRQISGTTFAFDNLQVYKAPIFTDITVLTYNTHLFEDSTIECLCKCGAWNIFDPDRCDWDDFKYEDGTRLEKIADNVEGSWADIVVLEEVWAPAKQQWYIDRLNATYPYARRFDPPCDCRDAWPWYLEDCVFLCFDATEAWKYYTLGNGLVLLSKWPLSDVEFRRFPTFAKCLITEVTNCQDSWADKGVLTATVNVNGVPIRIGISHALTGPEDEKSKWDTQDVGRATFQLNGEAYIFSLNNINGLAHIRRFEDYSYFDEASQTQKHGAGWKQIYEGFCGSGYVSVVSFELNGHPYLFGLKSSNQGRVFRINDDPSTGWTQVYEGPMSSSYVPVTSFELDGHPYIFAVSNGNKGHILRINNDPSTGWSDAYEGNWPAGYNDTISFELDSHPYLFTYNNSNHRANIYRINDDPYTGCAKVYDGNWPVGYNDTISFELDSHPYIFTYNNPNHWARIYRINNDPCTGWSYLGAGDFVFSDYIAIKSFEMNGHPYLFAQRNCCDQDMDAPGCLPRPGEAYLKRIKDDPNGWEDLCQLEDIRIIRDATITDDGPPAIMMGDFNIHRGKYGIMDELFRKAGAVDAYLQVADTDQDGNTCDYNNNNLYKYFWDRDPEFDPTNPDNVDRIDYVYVKQSGAGLRLVPTEAHVERGWIYYSAQAGANWDLSDHYPLIATFRLETGCAVRMKGDFNCDRLVDIYDLAILCSAWLSEPNAAAWNLACDISEPHDEFVDLGDYSELARQWQTMPIHNITRDKWYEVIQAAIDDANDGEEIEAGPGYYYEAIDFKGKAITLRSTDPNDPKVVAATVINGFGHYHVVQCVSGEDADTVLAGFTITGGNANGIEHPHWHGGGMYCENSSPTVKNCVFSSNTAIFDGGGMFNYNNSSPTVTDCNFSGNSAQRYGGGMANYSSSPTVTDCTFSSNTAAMYGGGMYNDNSSPTVTNCNFTGNTARDGGGMYNSSSSPIVTNCTFNNNIVLAISVSSGGGMYNNNSSPTVINCTFTSNTARAGGGMENRYGSSPTVTNCVFKGNAAMVGGGILNENGTSPTLTNCIFISNTASVYGGGGMANDVSNPTVTNCTFRGNTASTSGGGMANYDNSNPNVTNCIFSGNVISISGGGMYNSTNSSPTINNCTFSGNSAYDGGGMNNYNNSNPNVTNCIFSSNTASYGGGMMNDNGRPTVTNCTFSGNTASTGGGMFNYSKNPTVTNCILWGNTPGEIYNNSSSPIVTYSDIKGGYFGTGNINADPCFIDAVSGDFRLKAGSPCIDAGNNGAAGLPATDLAGNPRIMDGDHDGTSTVDMGAFELQALPIHNFTQDRWYETIQMAIDDATNGDEIEVYPGTYKEAIDFNGKAIRLYSTDGPNDTIIDGTGNYHVIQCVSGEDANTVLDGFTITGGNANGTSPYDRGGGMYNSYSSPTVTNCTFSSNLATSGIGGGMYNETASPTVTNCIFSGNSAGYGCGMGNYQGSNPIVTDCTFSGNSGYIGGGMFNDQGSNPTVTDCIFLSNAASLHGGGMHNEWSNPTVTNCIFSGNTASAHGGGMMNNYGSVSYTANCVFIGNTANGWGGGCCNASCTPYFINCTFRGNTASSGGAIYSDNSYTNIQNCILWADGANEIVYSSGTMSVTYSDVQGGYPGTGNINSDPCFVDAAGGNLHLSTADSPCVDAGNNNAIPADTPDLDGDGDTTEPIPFDLDGNPRVWNDIVDIGAYEYLIPSPPISSAGNLEYLAIICANWLSGTEPEL